MGLKIHEEMRNKEQTFLHKLGTTLESCRLTSTQSGCSRLCFFLLRVTRATWLEACASLCSKMLLFLVFPQFCPPLVRSSVRIRFSFPRYFLFHSCTSISNSKPLPECTFCSWVVHLKDNAFNRDLIWTWSLAMGWKSWLSQLGWCERFV